MQRTIGDESKNIVLGIVPANGQNDFYQYEVKNGKLYVKATAVNALTRGVYDYLKNNVGG